jgi:hypothetical protein
MGCWLAGSLGGWLGCVLSGGGWLGCVLSGGGWAAAGQRLHRQAPGGFGGLGW